MLWTFNITPVACPTPAGAALPSWKQPWHTDPESNASQTSPQIWKLTHTPLQPNWLGDIETTLSLAPRAAHIGEKTK